jgi:tRNA nucleotidyltransferase/poly(A) polymerase
MLEEARAVLAGEDAWVVGGAVRDELLGRPVLDLDIACRDPQAAARAYARGGGAPFPLSERHGAWRVVLDDGRTVDFTPLRDGIDDDLATRDFTINAIAQPLAGGEHRDPFCGREDLDAKLIRAVSPSVFEDDPLRLLRAVRLADELGFHLEPETERLVREQKQRVTEPAGERVVGELLQLSASGYERLEELGLLEPLGGSRDHLGRLKMIDTPEYRLASALGEAALRLPISRDLARYVRTLLRARPPEDDSARAIHRFRRATEPWALDALEYLGEAGFSEAVREARRRDPAEPLVRGNELGLPPGPRVGQLLDLIAEERAAGTISTREEAIDLVKRHVDD